MPGLIKNAEILYSRMSGSPQSDPSHTEASRAPTQLWSDPSFRRLLSERLSSPGVGSQLRASDTPPTYPARQDAAEEMDFAIPVGTQRPWMERGWVPNLDEPEPELATFFNQPQQSVLDSERDTASSISSSANNSRQAGHSSLLGGLARAENEHTLASGAGLRILLGMPLGAEHFQQGVSADPLLQSRFAHVFYSSDEESEELDEYEHEENGEDVPALAHSRQTIALDNVANTYGEGEPNPTIPIDIPEILPSLSPSLSAYNSGSEGSEPITPVDAPRIEAFLGPAPIVGRTTDEIISTQQLSEHLSDRIEAMEMLAMQAIEHVCRNVNTWFLSNNSIPNHFGLQKDYADLMLNVLRQRDDFWMKAAAGCLQTQGIFWLAWVLEGGSKYLPLIQLLEDQECLPPIIDELAELMGGYD